MERGTGMTAGVRRAGGSPMRLLPRPTASIAALAVAFAAACGPGEGPGRAEVVLSVGYAAPAEAGGLDQIIAPLTGEGLVRTGPDGRVEPVLADSWEINPSGTTITTLLRQDVSFHDGSPLTASDVKSSLDRSRQNPRTVRSNPGIGDIASIEVPEPYRIVINLARPSAQLVLFDLTVRVEKTNPDGQRIATGPFFVESASEDETTLRANPHYHLGRSEIETVRIKTYPTLRTAWAAMMRSEIDVLFSVPIQAREFIEVDSNVRVFSRATPYAYALVFNTRRPPFDDRRIRRALSRAIDRDAIIERAFRGHSTVASGIWPSHWVYEGVELTYDYDPREADRQLSNLGLHQSVSADQGSTGRAPSRLSFEVLVGIGVDVALWEPIALLVQKQLRQIGVDMAIAARPFGEIDQQIRGDDWDAVLLPVNTARNLSRLYRYWHSSERSAVSGFTGADDTLESLRSSVTEAEMSALAREIQRILFEEAPAIFLAAPQDARAVSRRFVVPDEPGRAVMETLWQWRVADEPSGN